MFCFHGLMSSGLMLPRSYFFWYYVAQVLCPLVLCYVGPNNLDLCYCAVFGCMSTVLLHALASRQTALQVLCLLPTLGDSVQGFDHYSR